MGHDVSVTLLPYSAEEFFWQIEIVLKASIRVCAGLAKSASAFLLGVTFNCTVQEAAVADCLISSVQELVCLAVKFGKGFSAQC